MTDRIIAETSRLANIVYGCNHLLDGLKFHCSPIGKVTFEKDIDIEIHRDLFDALREPLIELVSKIRQEAMTECGRYELKAVEINPEENE